MRQWGTRQPNIIPGETVPEETPVPSGGLVLEGSVALEETILGVDVAERQSVDARRQGTQNHSRGEVTVDDGNSIDTVELDPTRICSAPRDSTSVEFKPYRVALIHEQKVSIQR